MKPNDRRMFLKSSLAVAMSATAPGILSGMPSVFARASVQPDAKQFLEAIVAGDRNKVQRMLSENDKLLEASDADGRSGYVLAIISGHPEIAKVLIEAGYQTDLHEAALGLDWTRFDELTVGGGPEVIERVNAYHPVGGSAMFAAAVGGAGTDIWRVYAKCGGPNVTSEQSELSPVQAALRFKNLETAELTAFTLLSNSADPNLAGGGDSSPLHIATERGSMDIVEMLVRHGANIEAKDRAGKTSLKIAQANENQELIDLLENHDKIPRTHTASRASVNRAGEVYDDPNWEGIDGLKRSEFVGASHGNMDRVKEFLGRERRYAHSVSTTGERAVEAGAHVGNRPIVDLLLDSGAPYSLPTAVMMNDMESAERFLVQEPDRIHERGAHDFPLLWYPIIGRCELEMLQMLLDRGADVEQQSLIGTTALHFACMRDDVAAVDLLIEHGADVKRVGRKFGKKQTPLQLSRDKKIIELLKAKGA